jgi:AcrR family transcriptional regulator
VNGMHSQGSTGLALLWGVGARVSRGPRARYALGEVIDAGIAIADEGGIAGLSLASIAESLGLVTTALYRYVGSKDELVELMVDRALGPVPERPDDSWRDRAELWSSELLRRYSEHPWIVMVQPRGAPRHPNRVAWIDALLADLADGPVVAPLVTALILDSMARTFAPFAVSTEPEPLPNWLIEVVAARHPRYARELSRDWTGLDDDFSAAVRTVLDGASVKHTSSPHPSGR